MQFSVQQVFTTSVFIVIQYVKIPISVEYMIL
jgi:hypothetical protein